MQGHPGVKVKVRPKVKGQNVRSRVKGQKVVGQRVSPSLEFN